MKDLMDNIYHNIIIVSAFCGMIIACMLTCQAAPSEEVISGVAEQLEEGKTEFEIGYELESGENEREVIHDILKMVRNYSDEAAKASFNMQDYCLDVRGDVLTSAQFEYAVEKGTQEDMDREYDRMFKEICGGMHNFETASDRRKLNAILAYMFKEFSYGFKEATKEQKYGLLESITDSKTMTCTDYSEVIDELCERMGIECRIIVNEGHAWNYVRLDDSAEYIQIDGTMKYGPYVMFNDGYHRFDYKPADEVVMASLMDNFIFWYQSFPIIMYLITGVFILSVGKVIERRISWKKHHNKHAQIKSYRKQSISAMAAVR